MATLTLPTRESTEPRERALSKAIATAEAAIRDADATIARLGRSRNVAKHAAELGSLSDRRALLVAERDLHSYELEALHEATRAALRAVWVELDKRIVAEFGDYYADTVVIPRGDGGYEVALTTGNLYPDGRREKRFGYEATIYAPHPSWGNPEWAPAYVGWGSVSGMDTTAKAREMLRVHELSIVIAERINDLLGLG